MQGNMQYLALNKCMHFSDANIGILKKWNCLSSWIFTTVSGRSYLLSLTAWGTPAVNMFPSFARFEESESLTAKSVMPPRTQGCACLYVREKCIFCCSKSWPLTLTQCAVENSHFHRKQSHLMPLSINSQNCPAQAKIIPLT